MNALVIDDSEAMRKLVVAALEAEGFEVTTAKSGLDALKFLTPDHPFKIIITDVNMPNINGLEIVRRVREDASRKKTPVLIISTDSSHKDVERGLKLGAAGYLTKPFKPEKLIEHVRFYLGLGPKPEP